MKKVAGIRFLMMIIAAAVLTASAHAQASSQPANGALPNLPESDALVYFNLRRLLNDALPRILPEKTLAEMKSGIDQVKQKTGIDLYGIENATLGLKFNKLTLSGSAPDFVFVVRGSFNADALLSLMRIGLNGKYTEQKYGSRTITTMKMSDLMSAGDNKTAPAIPGVAQISVTSLDSGTVALGSPEYLKAAIDAQSGQHLINPELIALAMKDPDALFSVAGIVPPGVLSSLAPKETQGNEEIAKLLSGIDQIYLSLGMDAANFNLLLTIRTGTAENARTLSGLLDMITHAVGGDVKDKTAKAVLDSLKVTTEGSEVQVRTAIPQDAAATFVRGLMQPAKPAVAAPSQESKTTPKKPAPGKTPAKKPVKKT
jgi:hypothetical protein